MAEEIRPGIGIKAETEEALNKAAEIFGETEPYPYHSVTEHFDRINLTLKKLRVNAEIYLADQNGIPIVEVPED